MDINPMDGDRQYANGWRSRTLDNGKELYYNLGGDGRSSLGPCFNVPSDLLEETAPAPWGLSQLPSSPADKDRAPAKYSAPASPKLHSTPSRRSQPVVIQAKSPRASQPDVAAKKKNPASSSTSSGECPPPGNATSNHTRHPALF